MSWFSKQGSLYMAAGAELRSEKNEMPEARIILADPGLRPPKS